MQPLGRKPSSYNYKDNHPPKGYCNWWESEIRNDQNKKAARQKAKKDIKSELKLSHIV